MKDEITKQNVITRRSVLAMFSAGLAGAACYPFAGITKEPEPKDPKPDKWTVAFGKSKAVTLLEISSAIEPIDFNQDSITGEIYHTSITNRIVFTIEGTASDAGLNSDIVGRQINVTAKLNGELFALGDAMCVGIYSIGTILDEPTVRITMVRSVIT